MGDYQTELARSARRDLDKLDDKTLDRVRRAIDSLAKNPRPHGSLKLVGPEREYRIRVGNYRVIYEVDDDAVQVTVIHVRHRREAYR